MNDKNGKVDVLLMLRALADQFEIMGQVARARAIREAHAATAELIDAAHAQQDAVPLPLLSTRLIAALARVQS
jgi:hypothetical protein